MVPPSERLKPHDLVRLQIDQRLVVGFDRSIAYGGAKLSLDKITLANLGVHFQFEEPKSAARFILCTIESDIGFAQDLGIVLAIPWYEGDTDANPDVVPHRATRDRFAQFRDDPQCDVGGLL
jgi:hypothetical protein